MPLTLRQSDAEDRTQRQPQLPLARLTLETAAVLGTDADLVQTAWHLQHFLALVNWPPTPLKHILSTFSWAPVAPPLVPTPLRCCAAGRVAAESLYKD